VTRVTSSPALIVGVLFCSGCTLFSPVNTETTKNVLNTVPLDVPSEKGHPATLLVLVPETTAAYATTQMAYSTRPYQIAYYAKNEWVETPSQMIQPLVVATLRSTHYFSEVLPAPYFGSHTFGLRIEVLELEQDFTSEPPVLRLAMRVSLSRDATNEIVATKDLSVNQPMRERNPHAGVVAANEAMPNLLRDLASFVVEKAD
jgi:cholesterol transport system auxiliary component